MGFEPVEVTARWEAAGRFNPSGMNWQGAYYHFVSTGRHWEDEDGWHILCMLEGGQVVELSFRLNPAGWQLRTPASGGLSPASAQRA